VGGLDDVVDPLHARLVALRQRLDQRHLVTNDEAVGAGDADPELERRPDGGQIAEQTKAISTDKKVSAVRVFLRFRLLKTR
jgi:hypothetical protein